jgi:parvulin-like peptidyl-prolyl isomerase
LNAQVASHAPTGVAKKAPSKTSAAPLPVITTKPVARVNGAVLTDLDLTREMFAMFPYARLHSGFPKGMEPEIRRGALDMIIFEELLYQEAKRRGVTIPPEQLAKAEVSFKKQFANKAELQQYMQVEANGSPAAVKEKIRRSLLIEKMLKTEITTKAKPTPAQVRAFYDKNPKLFEHGETFHIQSISIIPPQNPSADVIKEAKARADEAYKSAKTTKNYREFGLLAERVSDDDFHVNFGDHKTKAKEELPPDVVKAAHAMKPGDISNLMQLGNNFTFFRLVEHQSAGKTPFAEVRPQIQSDLEKQNIEQLRSALGDKLRKNATIEKL